MDWLLLAVAAFVAHAVFQAVQDREPIGRSGAPVTNAARLRLALLWPLRRVTTQPVPQPERDAFVSAWVAFFELAVTTYGFVLVYRWLEDAAISEETFPFALAGALLATALPLMLLSWMVAGLAALLLRVAFAAAMPPRR